jgi:hypothetical protein
MKLKKHLQGSLLHGGTMLPSPSRLPLLASASPQDSDPASTRVVSWWLCGFTTSSSQLEASLGLNGRRQPPNRFSRHPMSPGMTPLSTPSTRITPRNPDIDLALGSLRPLPHSRNGWWLLLPCLVNALVMAPSSYSLMLWPANNFASTDASMEGSPLATWTLVTSVPSSSESRLPMPCSTHPLATPVMPSVPSWTVVAPIRAPTMIKTLLLAPCRSWIDQ